MTDLHVVDRGAVRTITLDRPDSRNGLTHEFALQIVQAITGATLRPRDRDRRRQRRVLLRPRSQGRDGARAAQARELAQEHGRVVPRHHPRAAASARCRRSPRSTARPSASAATSRSLATSASLRARDVRRDLRQARPHARRRQYVPPAAHHRPRSCARAVLYGRSRRRGTRRCASASRTSVVPDADLDAHVAALADRFAAGPPLAYEAVKNAVYDNLDEASLSRALDREADGQMQLLASKDFAEGVTAFLQKRPPVFRANRRVRIHGRSIRS